MLSRAKPLKRTRFKWKPRSRKTKTRVILYGAAYPELRQQKAMAANERCEMCGKRAPYVTGSDIPLWAGQLCHRERGAKRSSTIQGTFWGCSRCHDEYDGRNAKPCPPKVSLVLVEGMPRDGGQVGPSQ